jgi:hypothetical protein
LLHATPGTFLRPGVITSLILTFGSTTRVAGDPSFFGVHIHVVMWTCGKSMRLTDQMKATSDLETYQSSTRDQL